MRARPIVLAALGLILAARGAAAQGAVVGDPVAGEALFEDRCLLCHTAGAGAQGPNLKGVFGRKAASLPGYPYSAALQQSGLTWNAPTLDRFLTDPGKLVPGSAMAIRVPDPKQRRDLISYLATRK